MNFGELKTAIKTRLIDKNGTAISSPDVESAINSSIKYWKQEKFWFNQRQGNITLVEGTNLLSLPSDFLYPVNFVLPYQNVIDRMDIVSMNEYDDAYFSQSGIPMGVVFINGQYFTNTTASADFTVTSRYVKDYDDLEEDDDLNDFLYYADDLIMYEALYRLTKDILQDVNMAAVHQASAQAEKTNLKERSRKMTGVNRIAVEMF